MSGSESKGFIILGKLECNGKDMDTGGGRRRGRDQLFLKEEEKIQEKAPV